jgi:hypothetical protein
MPNPLLHSRWFLHKAESGKMKAEIFDYNLRESVSFPEIQLSVFIFQL